MLLLLSTRLPKHVLQISTTLPHLQARAKSFMTVAISWLLTEARHSLVSSVFWGAWVAQIINGRGLRPGLWRLDISTQTKFELL